MDIFIAPGTVGETVYIPVVLSQTGHRETVYNDFHVGKGADVTIVAGCGIHNDGPTASQHDGIHSFYLAEGSRVTYIEQHCGTGGASGGRILNPVTNAFLEAGSYMLMDTIQTEGVDSTKRETNVEVADDATLVIKEKLMTYDEQSAETRFLVNLNGRGSSCNVASRSVAKDHSKQSFFSVINGNNDCMGHSECDAIIMDHGVVQAIPEVTTYHSDAQLIHEAAIGKIAGEQIIKLMTLGLDEEEATQQIIKGFLK